MRPLDKNSAPRPCVRRDRSPSARLRRGWAPRSSTSAPGVAGLLSAAPWRSARSNSCSREGNIGLPIKSPPSGVSGRLTKAAMPLPAALKGQRRRAVGIRQKQFAAATGGPSASGNDGKAQAGKIARHPSSAKSFRRPSTSGSPASEAMEWMRVNGGEKEAGASAGASGESRKTTSRAPSLTRREMISSASPVKAAGAASRKHRPFPAHRGPSLSAAANEIDSRRGFERRHQRAADVKRGAAPVGVRRRR